MATPTNRPSHLKALLRKNWILWRRSWIVSLMEICIPLLFAAILVAFRKSSPTIDVPQTSYYNPTPPSYPFAFSGSIDALSAYYQKNCSQAQNGGVVALAPASDPQILELNSILTSSNIQTQLFQTNDDIDAYTTSATYTLTGNTLCYGIVMAQNNIDNQYTYLLRWNLSASDIPSTTDNLIKPIANANYITLYEYLTSGALLMQNLLDNLILKKETGSPTANIAYQVASKTVPAYTNDQFAVSMQGQTRFFLDLPLLLIFLRFVNGIMREKEKRIREGMKIMGLKNSAFYASWFITYFLIFTVTSFLVSAVLKGGLLKLSNYGLIFLWHWEFSICFLCFGFLLTVFFNKAKTANVAGFVLALELGFIPAALDSTSAPIKQIFASLAPQASMGLSADFMLKLEAAGVGLTADSVNLEVQGYRMTFHYLIMLLDCALFLLLGAYLDQVLPSEFGIRKHPLFCLMRNGRKKKDLSRVEVDPEDGSASTNSQYFEEPEPNMKNEDDSNQSVMVKSLKKIYGNGKLAVDDVSFNMYKSQIFALLGHNGAGKTSTISMITGLYGATSGTTSVYGLDIQDDLEDVRKIMGICPQHDILFDDLTVEEHLRLFAVFKGVPEAEITEQVNKTIVDIGLGEKRNYYSKNLSGGQKRKLSVGIAFIGGSKFIILDEPSSGMDTSARRKLWEMLKNYKHDRVVLLTTHFMDEADYLGDRIGIMAEGKLRCMGRPLFLKNKFGMGYSLTLVKKDINDPSQPIKDLLKTYVPESKVLSDVSAEVAFQLPLEAASKFQKLFDALDKDLEKLRISTYGVSVTSLEEVFLNVAKLSAPEKHFQKQEDDKADEDLDSFNLQQQRIKSPWKIFWLHFFALVVKRIRYFKRDKQSLVCELLIPVVMIIIGIVIAKSLFNTQIVPLNLSDNLYPYQFQVDYNANLPTTNDAINPYFISNFNQNTFNMKAQQVTTVADFDTQVFNDQGKDVIHSPVNVFSFYVAQFNTVTNRYQYLAEIDTRAKDASVFAVNKINNAILRTATGNPTKKINVVVSPFMKTQGSKKVDAIYSGVIYALVFAIGMSFIPASVITYIVKEREANAKHQQIVSGVSLAAYWFSNYFVDLVKYMFPAIINPLMAQAFNATALIQDDKLGALWALFMFYGMAIIPFVYLTSFLFKDYGTAQITCFFFNFGSGFIGGLAVGMLKLFSSTGNVANVLQWILRPFPTFAMTYGFIDIANRDIYALQNKVATIPIFDISLVGGDILMLGIAAVVFMAGVFLVEYLKNVQSISGLLSGEKNIQYVPKKIDDDVEREAKEVEASDDKTYSIKVEKLRKVYALGEGKFKVAVDQLSFGVKNGECFALLGVNGAGKTTTFKILSGDYLQTSGNAQIRGYNLPSQLNLARYEIGYCPQFDALLENLTSREHLELYAAIKGIPYELRERFVKKQLKEMNLHQYENVLAGTYSGGNKRKLSVALAMIGNPSVVFLDEPSSGMDPEARRFMWNVISRISTERKLSSIILTTHSMEEAEALATKMGIMVNGGLQCLGTSQHIKNKFGGGYEIEIKTHIPAKDLVQKTLASLKLQAGQRVDRAEVDQILDGMKASHLKEQLHDEGTGSAIFAQLKTGKPTADSIVEYVFIELNGESIKTLLSSKFGAVSIIEHFQTFFRYRVGNNITIGAFFGLMEENKDKLTIQQYSIRQSTIEQIFNTFAQREDTRPPVKKGESSLDTAAVKISC